MILPIKGGRITAPFSEMRPLMASPKTHVHGALDVAGGDGVVRAPVAGVAQSYAIFRAEAGMWWSKDDKPEILGIPWRDYWHDIFGGLVAIQGEDGRLHILCHFWVRSIICGGGQSPFTFDRYIESALPGRWPHHLLVSAPIRLYEGQTIAKLGSAGQSTGPHVHWEIHHQSNRLDSYSDRVNPETLL